MINLNLDWWGRAATLLLEKKYLKTIFNTFGMNCHQCAGTLDAGYVGRDEEITVLDIDSIVHKG